MQFFKKTYEGSGFIFIFIEIKVKDRNEELSKEGSSRVQIYKQFNIIHSYTLECSFHSPGNTLIPLSPVSNENKVIDK